MRALEISDSWTRKEGGVETDWRPMVKVDHRPDKLRNYTALELISEETGTRRVFFFTEEEGYVDFCVWTPENERGYGGRRFSLFVKQFYSIDADTDEVKIATALDWKNQEHTGWWAFNGPWSSRPSVMNGLAIRYDFLDWPLSIEASVDSADPDQYNVAGHVTVGWLNDAIVKLDAPYEVVLADYEKADDEWLREARYDFVKLDREEVK